MSSKNTENCFDVHQYLFIVDFRGPEAMPIIVQETGRCKKKNHKNSVVIRSLDALLYYVIFHNSPTPLTRRTSYSTMLSSVSRLPSVKGRKTWWTCNCGEKRKTCANKGKSKKVFPLGRRSATTKKKPNSTSSSSPSLALCDFFDYFRLFFHHLHRLRE